MKYVAAAFVLIMLANTCNAWSDDALWSAVSWQKPDAEVPPMVFDLANVKNTTNPAETTGFWLINFYAPWCGYAQQFAPTLQQLASDLDNMESGVGVAQVDCVANNDVCNKYGIRLSPTVAMFLDGQIKDKYKGERDLPSLEQFIVAEEANVTELLWELDE